MGAQTLFWWLRPPYYFDTSSCTSRPSLEHVGIRIILALTVSRRCNDNMWAGSRSWIVTRLSSIMTDIYGQWWVRLGCAFEMLVLHHICAKRAARSRLVQKKTIRLRGGAVARFGYEFPNPKAPFQKIFKPSSFSAAAKPLKSQQTSSSQNLEPQTLKIYTDGNGVPKQKKSYIYI